MAITTLSTVSATLNANDTRKICKEGRGSEFEAAAGCSAQPRRAGVRMIASGIQGLRFQMRGGLY